MDSITNTAMARCPDCVRLVNPGPLPQIGRRFPCSNCGAYLEVINLEPLEFDWAFNKPEPDWDTDEEEWDEEEWEDEWDDDWDDTDGRGSGYW